MGDDFVVGDAGADTDAAIVDGDAAQFGEAAEVEQRDRPARPAAVKVEEEVGAARDRPNSRVCRQDFESVGETARAFDALHNSPWRLNGVQLPGSHLVGALIYKV